MQQSEQITELAAALAAAQAAMNGVRPDSHNPHFKSTYASLGAIIGAVKPHLAANGLAFSQSIQQSDTGIVVVTQLTHGGSGQWMRGQAYVPVDKATAQGVGSATTYGRRYSLAALLGIADTEDDDGNEASQRGSGKAKRQTMKDAVKKRPTNETELGHVVSICAGNPPKNAESKDGDIWIDYAEDPARVLRCDGDGGYDELMTSDEPYAPAHKTLAAMAIERAKSQDIGVKELLDMVGAEDGADTKPTKFSDASIGALARVLAEMECPL